VFTKILVNCFLSLLALLVAYFALHQAPQTMPLAAASSVVPNFAEVVVAQPPHVEAAEVPQPTVTMTMAPAPAPTPAVAQAVAPAVQTPTGTETLLLVEDQADVRRLALSILEASGYRLLQAENAEQALGLSASYAGKIDLLVTDVIMPGLNGRQLADRLVEERPGLKVLYTSGYSADVIALQGSLEPGMEYLPKPFGAAQLSSKVREVLGSGRPAGRPVAIDDTPATGP